MPVFTLIGDKTALEVTGSVHGRDDVRKALREFIATFDFVDRQILSEVVEGDRAAVHSCLVVRYGPTRETWTADCLDLLTFKDGKIIELTEFADTAQIRDKISGAVKDRSAPYAKTQSGGSFKEKEADGFPARRSVMLDIVPPPD